MGNCCSAKKESVSNPTKLNTNETLHQRKNEEKYETPIIVKRDNNKKTANNMQFQNIITHKSEEN